MQIGSELRLVDLVAGRPHGAGDPLLPACERVCDGFLEFSLTALLRRTQHTARLLVG